MTEATPKGARLPFATKALYGSGTIAFGVKDQGFAALLLLYYNQVVGLPALWVGAAIMIAMIVDALFDPVLGQISDDLRSPWGRRHPFMYAAALPIALSYFFLWTPPALPEIGQFAYLVLVAVIVRVSISLYEIPSTALLAEFTTDYDERTRLVAYRYFFGVVGGIVMNILTFSVFLKPGADQSVGQLNAAGYVTYAAVAAVIMLVSVLVSSIGTHRQIAALAVPADRGAFSLSRIARDILGVLTDRVYASILAASFFFAISTGLTTALGIYFWTYFWQLSEQQITILTGCALIGIVLAFVLPLPLSMRFGKKPVAMALYALGCLSGVTPLTLRLLDVLPPNGAPVIMPVLMVQFAFSIMCSIGASILAVSMVADVGEQMRMSTGRRIEGLLFSATTMVNKAVSGMGVFLSAVLLAAVDFPGAAQPGDVGVVSLDRLALTYILTVLAVSAAAIACLGFYPITRAHHAETVRRLAQPAE